MQHKYGHAWEWAVTGVLLVAFLLVDFATPRWWSSGPEPTSVLALGVCIGQVNLIAAWAAIGPGNLAVRLPWSAALGLMMWYALVLGGRVAQPCCSLDDAAVLGVALLGWLLIAQVPLWVAKAAFRWRLIRGGGAAVSADGPPQFTVRHLLLGTLLLSVALSPCRAVLPPSRLAYPQIGREFYIMLVAAVVCNLVVTVPCIWGALLTAARTPSLVVRWLGHCMVLTALELTAVCVAFGLPPKPHEKLLLYYITNVAQGAAVFVPLRAFRAFGFRMVRLPRVVAAESALAAAVQLPDKLIGAEIH
jgi:hypothetical protein